MADLLILCATPHEMSAFLAQYPPNQEQVTRTGVRILSGRIDKTPYSLAFTGVGVFNTASTLTLLLERLTPSVILQTGIAGVFEKSGYGLGDIGLADREHYIHTGIADGNTEADPLPFDLIRDQPSTRKGIYHFEHELLLSAYDRLIREFGASPTAICKGPFITVSGITGGSGRADELYSAFTPVMEAMEGAAAAHIAALYRTSFLEVRSASNFVGEREKSKWDIPGAINRMPGICRAVSGMEMA